MIYEFYSKDLSLHFINFIASEGSNPPYKWRNILQPELYFKQDFSNSPRLPFTIKTNKFINEI